MVEEENTAQLVALPAHLRERHFFAKSSPFLHPALTLEEWFVCKPLAEKVVGNVHWWLGDWLNFGKAKWGHTPKYQEAVKLSGFEYSTLRNDAWVAAAIEKPRRRSTLSFCHHAEVAPFPPEQQEWLLNQAEANGWSIAQLRREKKKLHIRQYISHTPSGGENTHV